MAERVSRGDVWLYEFQAPDKQRPVLVLTRQEVIGLLRTVMVAPITTSIRGAPSEVVLGISEGLKHDSVANLDHVQTVAKAQLRRRLGQASPETMHAVCRALAIAVGCSAAG